ncbi:PBP1A family penicillin-binding protein [Myxococcota bacterium]|nr:PBP1A family penicillin-binding protein [Myxococcota bacterium]
MTTEAEDTVQVPVHRPSPKKWKRWLLRLTVLGLALVVVGAIGAAAAIAILAEDLPEIRTLADYQPKQSTVVFGPEGQVVARFASERRTVVPYERIPRVMIDSVIASEDSDFFSHAGLDYVGMLRCAVKNTFSGRIACGASTITQQTVKTFLLSPKQTLGRKAREMILAKRVEDALTKDEILFLYLNQIYFGHGAYGVEEAARVFFGKSVGQLTVEEAALLAGLPQSPTRLDPYKHPERALARRSYVLGRLKALGKIDDETFEKANTSPLNLDWNAAERDLDSNNHYAAHVRGILEAMVGKERAADGGLKVYTGLAPSQQRVAERALREGLRALDKRQGWRGPLLRLPTNQLAELRTQLEARRSKLAAPKTVTSTSGANGPVIWDLSGLVPGRATDDLEVIVESARFPRFAVDEVYGGLVTKVDDTGKEAVVELGGGVEVVLPMKSGLSWARKFDNNRATRAPSSPSEVLQVGDVVLVRATGEKKADAPAKKGKKAAEPRGATGTPVIVGILEQPPKVEAALVAIEPTTREVRAMVGGFGVGAGTFNRAVQAKRQAGSTFKPIVYAAAFETEKFTPVSPCLDAPRVYRDPWTGRSWKPENYGGGFDGEISLRTALTHSKNMCSVELIDKIGAEHVLEAAKRVGVSSEMPKNLTVALGSGDVTPLEMTNVYATFASGGVYAEPIFVKKVVDADGTVIFEAKPEPKQGLRPEIAYLVTSLMQSVVEAGTAQRVKVLERPVAGKTGTSNEARNAWFVGYTPDLVVGVWVGFDDNEPLGPTETGGRAAIPIWLDFMQAATKDAPVRDFVVPQGVLFTWVDAKSGKLSTPDSPDAKNEPFIAGTEPKEFHEGSRQPKNFGLDDYE